MKNSDFLWQVSGYLQEFAKQMEIAKKDQDWQEITRLSKILREEAKRCEKRGDECYEKQD